ncbi:MAG: hypothetical protein NVS4B10_06240 [Myxococcales bacterium]
MGARAQLLTAVLCLGLACAACKGGRAPESAPAQPAAATLPPPAAVDEVEPNDAQHAQGVPERAIVSGSLAPRRGVADDDWYRVAPGPGRLLALQIELSEARAADAGPGRFDAALEIYDRDRNRLLRARATSAAPAFLPAVACLEACFVRVSGTTAARYTLTLLGAPPMDGAELEPNDCAVDATKVAAGASAQGTFGSPEDEDWFRVFTAAPQPGQFLRLELSGVPGVRPELEVRSLVDGVLLATLRAPAAGEGIFVRDLALELPPPPPPPVSPPGPTPPPQPAAPTPPFGAASGAPDGGGALPGAGVADLGAAGAGAAPLDAVPLDAGAATPGEPPGAAGVADAGADPVAASEPAARTSLRPEAAVAAADAGAARSAGAPVVPAADAGRAAGSATAAAQPPAPAAAPPPSGPPSAGYYIVLKSGWVPAEKPGARPHRGANPRAPYTLRTAVEQGPLDLETEPNDDPAHATDLTAGAREGYLSPPGDVDWYRVRATAPSILRAEVSALVRADVELSVWLAPVNPGEKPTLLARANEGGVREGEILPAVGIPAGDALVKVESALRTLDGKSARDGEDRETLYKLTATLVPDDGTQDREPNDDLAHAQPATLPARITGTLWPKKDVDVFRFHVPEGHVPLDLKVSAVRGVDVMLTLREVGTSGSGQETAEVIGTADQVRGEGAEALLAVPLKAGDYTVEVSSPRREASATQQYVLEIRDSQ